MFDTQGLQFVENVFKAATAFIALVAAVIGLLQLWRQGKRGKSLESLIGRSNLSTAEKDFLYRYIKIFRGSIVTLVLLLLGVLAAIVASVVFPRTDHQVLSRYLARRDPQLFSHSRDGLYDVARVFHDRGALETESDLRETLRETRHSFDLLANNAAIVTRFFYDDILEALKRGVDFRVVLLDPTDRNTSNYRAFAEAIGTTTSLHADELHETLQRLNRLKVLLREDPKTYPGTLEVRWLDKTLLYTMWIKDREGPEAMAHVGVHLYGGKDTWPAFRVSRDGGDLIINLSREFSLLWQSARKEL